MPNICSRLSVLSSRRVCLAKVVGLCAVLVLTGMYPASSLVAAESSRQIQTIPSTSKVHPKPDDDLLTLRQYADGGDVEAQILLAVRYQNGTRDMQPELAESVRWFRAAAEQGHPLGIMKTSTAYYLGKGVARDGVEAIKWAIISASLATADGNRQAGLAKADSIAVDMKLTAPLRAEAEKRAADWLTAFKARKK